VILCPSSPLKNALMGVTSVVTKVYASMAKHSPKR